MGGSSFLTRKCFGCGAANWVTFSRIGPSTRLPSASESNTGSADKDENSTPSAIIVGTATVSALLCLCLVVLVLRNFRRRRSLRPESSDTSIPGGDVPEDTLDQTILWKSVEGQEEGEDACNEGAGRRRSAKRVEQLVVMAGEDMPSFLAHPVPASTLAACNVHIQCPPLHL